MSAGQYITVCGQQYSTCFEVTHKVARNVLNNRVGKMKLELQRLIQNRIYFNVGVESIDLARDAIEHSVWRSSGRELGPLLRDAIMDLICQNDSIE